VLDYAEQQRAPGKHAVGIGIVLGLHLLLGWALVNGLAQRMIEVIKAPIETKIIEEVKPPPPPPPENLPPPPKFAPPPPSFVPPPEINVNPPPTPAPTITTTQVAPPPAPVFIAPLFNDFGPMRDPALEAEILALADRAGIAGSRVFEVDKSVDTNTVNAYVTGFASTKRIVLWDTIIARLDHDQLLVVMGHEMGHYVLGHVRDSMIALAIAIPLALGGFHALARRLIARFHARFGFTRLDDVAALPLFLVLIGLFNLALAPVANAWSRRQEHEADRFALEITHDNLGCAGAFARLQESNLANPRPGPLFTFWRASHPSLGERIDFCNEYRPWARGEPEVYADRFK